jgi:protein-tyrosine phosphatase
MSDGEHETTIASFAAVKGSDEFVDGVESVRAYVHLPIMDGPYPGMAWLKMSVSIVEALMENHKKVYIHCRAGISRSSMLTAAVVMKKNGWRDHNKTLNFIAEKNPAIDPAPNFIRILKEFEREF